ncbi:Alcohol dehydrogenase [Acidisarcina polymorpha]|uniref:Alcohol dehydrogenase n=1 Tax=Acidisarcina polymorpha TaxID=2211140 RepID=A0A2Z5G580_9BACT|nr:NAD(P)-dependent alcohol dehydrogenase [Acidisarcina polymorpha]AXC13937.1 Alcohol dehydrogenase [Acidisarcina polymorpha]
MFETTGYALESATAPLTPLTFNRRDPRPVDVAMKILFCGVCHADVGLAHGEWGFGNYPCVPGHEIVGRVTAVGSKVSKYKVGDLVGVGPLVDSCRTCAACKEGHEQLCDTGFTPTYMGPDKDFGHTYGGYSHDIVVDENYVVRVPGTINAAAAAPLLCAGITSYSPLKRANVGPGMTVGVIGIGGVGHMAIKFAKAMGAKVVALTTSAGKADDARRLGADDVLVTTDADAMTKSKERFDVILDTVAVSHNLNGYLGLVKREGELCLLGTPPELTAAALALIFRSKRLTGSFFGGIAETQEMLDFSAKHGIAADIEIVRLDQINEAWKRMIAADVRYRFVIEMALTQPA